MRLCGNRHLAYCTNIHRGESWEQTFATLKNYTLRVRDRVADSQPYAIGLRLGAAAAEELERDENLEAFQEWLNEENCYVFTINGFPYGTFHGARVKEDVYLPDWTTPERLAYTQRLFRIISVLAPPAVGGSVSTVPGSYKAFIQSEEQEKAMRANLWRCVEYVEGLAAETGKALHLGLEPEPLCYLETSEETVRFFDELRADRPNDTRINDFLGVNYDTCHLAIEHEKPNEALGRFQAFGVKISKIHLSSALRVSPTAESLRSLRDFCDPVYFHQVIGRQHSGELLRIKDLDQALDQQSAADLGLAEWLIHFHVPLHSQPSNLYGTTADHIQGLLDSLSNSPDELCSHFEMETYTWEVLPSAIKNRDVVDQLVEEYRWTLAEFGKRGIGLEQG